DRWHTAVAANMASDTPGSKAVIVSAESSVDPKTKVHSLKTKATRDFTNGAFIHTSFPTDLAIRTEKAFFSFAHGKTFSRDGEFKWEGDTLVNKIGQPLDGQSGPIVRTAENGLVTIDSKGNVYQGTQLISKI